MIFARREVFEKGERTVDYKPDHHSQSQRLLEAPFQFLIATY